MDGVPAGAVGGGVAEDGGDAPLHVHLDLDVLDPSEGRVNRYSTAGGVSLAALRATLEALARRERVASLTLSAYDPSYDGDGRAGRAAVEGVATLVDALAARVER